MVTIRTGFGIWEEARRVRVEPTTAIGGNITQTNVQKALEQVDAATQILKGQLRIVIAAGDATVSASEPGIAMNKTVGAATNVVLPPASSRNGLPVTVKDMKGDANTNNITVLPDASDALGIDANAQDILNINKASRTYRPVTGGWLRT